MRLTTYTDYSLRVLIALAVSQEKLTTIASLAGAYSISEHHLMKVVHQLGRAGYIETVRGHGGGLRLKKKPAEIGLGEVVRQTEPDFGLVECFRGSGTCAIQPACTLSGVLSEALRAFLSVLDQYTLADLIKKPQALGALLEIRAAVPSVNMQAKPRGTRG